MCHAVQLSLKGFLLYNNSMSLSQKNKKGPIFLNVSLDEFERRLESLNCIFSKLKGIIRCLNHAEKQVENANQNNTSPGKSGDGMFARLRRQSWSTVDANNVDIVTSAFNLVAKHNVLDYREGVLNALNALGLVDVSADEVAFAIDAALQGQLLTYNLEKILSFCI